MAANSDAWQELLRKLDKHDQKYDLQGIEPEYRISIQNNFPLCRDVDFEHVFFGESGWPLGLRNSNPSNFNKRAYAGGLSAFMRLSSIDYTLKRYVPEDFHSTTHTLSHEAEHIIVDAAKRFEIELDAFGSRDGDAVGLFAADLNLVRFQATLSGARSLANRGLLFECQAVARFGLEQLAWIWFAHSRTEEEFAKATGKQCIGILKSAYDTAGRIYGHLSTYAHWHPSEHWQFAARARETGQIASIIRNSLFKMYALCYCLLLERFAQK